MADRERPQQHTDHHTDRYQTDEDRHVHTDPASGDRTIDVAAAESEAAAVRGVWPGATALRPRDIPKEGWKQTLLRVKDELKDDNVALLAGGVAYYAFLAIFPGIVAAITLWSLISTPEQITATIRDFSATMPEEVTSLLQTQISDVARNSGGALSAGLLVGVLGALWSASAGMKGLMNAINAAYDEDETRGFLKVRGLAIALTLGAIVFMLVTATVITAVPPLLESIGLPASVATLISLLRWPLLAVAMMAALAVLYRYSGDRDEPEWQWVTWGAVAATGIWLVASLGFAVYARTAGSYAETYGTAAGFVVTLLWLFLSAFAVLIGAELNAELEHQTLTDTTVGEDEPMGQRGAAVADTPPTQDPETVESRTTTDA